jgi:hypothetical protein
MNSISDYCEQHVSLNNDMISYREDDYFNDCGIYDLRIALLIIKKSLEKNPYLSIGIQKTPCVNKVPVPTYEVKLTDMASLEESVIESLAAKLAEFSKVLLYQVPSRIKKCNGGLYAEMRIIGL